jgi:hypothetical protein
MQQFSGKIFIGETIRFQPGQVYTRCGFEDCLIEIDGSSFPDSTCTFQGCSFNFKGGAAGTISFLRQLWETPGMGSVLDVVFEQITGSKPLAKQFTKRRKVD